MNQYRSIKAEHSGEILFFRLGDFYEMFDEDAKEVSRLLNLTLTHRADHPMCGIPYHAVKVYIARLLRQGKKIAVCEQVGDPRAKGLTERKVVEVITPGTAVEEEYLEKSAHNYLACASMVKDKTGGEKIGFAYIDITTAAFFATSWDAGHNSEESFARCLGLSNPRELLIQESLASDSPAAKVLSQRQDIFVSRYPDWHFSQEASFKRLCEALGVINLKSFGLMPGSPEVPAAGFLLGYLEKNSSLPVSHVTSLRVFGENDFVVIDDSSRKNLEIAANLQDGSASFTLFDAVNYAKTAMGIRLLAEWLYFPLKNPRVIRERQEQVGRFVSDKKLRENARTILSSILDIERLSSRIALDKAHAKDVQALRASIESWIALRGITDTSDFSGTDTARGKEAADIINRAILPEPSTLLVEGGIIQDGWSAELDRLRSLKTNFNGILDEYAESERKKTGIANLKIRYNRLSGYYIEISRGKLASVPPHFILRRTLVNGDRYTTEKLSELEEELLSAEQNIVELERRLFLELRGTLKNYIPFFQEAAREIAYIDVTACFAHAASLHKWQCPLVDESDSFVIDEGRHPVVEKYLPAGEFVPNDTSLDGKTLALVTGPNMAGKSTYLRQNALIALLAQTGSFVPASNARIGIVDRIFCRVGASDNLARGESTFLVEMTETAHILRNATQKSLVIMDEVGRGTSTEDGLSIAWAVTEYLLNTVRCNTFFATHYHELTRLAHPQLSLLRMDVRENDGKIVFLKKISPGAAASSYGIHVAHLAGIPGIVLERANTILAALQKQAGDSSVEIDTEIRETSGGSAAIAVSPAAPGLFSDEELILDEILSCNPDAMTPIEALTLIARWKKSLSGR
jgi:DNA mismatch repair protein MutS